MSWPGGSSQPQQARLAQALHDFGDATDQAVRAWAGQLTMRQALDITYVITDILRLLETTAERLSRYRAGSKPAQDHDAWPDQPNEEITQAHTSISSARTALVNPFQEAYRSSGGWPEPGGDPARDGTAVFLAHLLCQRLNIADEPWPELSGTAESRDYLVEALICATDGLAWDIQNLARDAPEPMQTGLTEAVAHLDDTFGHLRESLICSAKRESRSIGRRGTRPQPAACHPSSRTCPGPPRQERPQRAAPRPHRCRGFPVLAHRLCRDAVPRDGSGGQPRRRALAPVTPIRAEGKPWTSPITSG